MPKIQVTAKPVKRLTLSQLLRMTPSEITARGRTQCHVVRKQYAPGSRDGFRRVYRKNKQYYNEMRTYTVCTDGKRNSYIRFFGKPDANTEVWVWCSCPYFTYNLEVVLAARNTSSIKLSNGELPKVRNPKRIPHLCKHLVVTAKAALTQNKDLAAKKVEEEEKKRAAAALKLGAQKDPERKKIPKGQFTNAPTTTGGLVEFS